MASTLLMDHPHLVVGVYSPTVNVACFLVQHLSSVKSELLTTIQKDVSIGPVSIQCCEKTTGHTLAYSEEAWA